MLTTVWVVAQFCAHQVFCTNGAILAAVFCGFVVFVIILRILIFLHIWHFGKRKKTTCQQFSNSLQKMAKNNILDKIGQSN